MKKLILNLILAFTVLSQSAHASDTSSLKAIFDDLTYSLTVEWDQKDMAAQNEIFKRFTSKMDEQYRAGLQPSDVADYIRSEMKETELADEIEEKLAQVNLNLMSPEEANSQLIKYINKQYKEGASWNPTLIIPGFLILFIGVASYIFYSANQREKRCPQGTTVMEFTCGKAGCTRTYVNENCLD